MSGRVVDGRFDTAMMPRAAYSPRWVTIAR
jgi:hypothetical protein